ncbi:MAG: hypothetical protein M1823_000114 [Watsoniomyces obsoletus]|nr:MAG: hypothetical protein M1823_000114 [Watsoniomyces obsoletus]
MRITLAVVAIATVVTALPHPYPQVDPNASPKDPSVESNGDEKTPGWVTPVVSALGLTAMGTTAWGVNEKRQHGKTRKALATARENLDAQGPKIKRLETFRRVWRNLGPRYKRLYGYQTNFLRGQTKVLDRTVQENKQLAAQVAESGEHGEKRFLAGYQQGKEMQDELLHYYYLSMEFCKKQKRPTVPQENGETDDDYGRRLQALCLETGVTLPGSAVAQTWLAPGRRVKTDKGWEVRPDPFSRVQLPTMQLPNPDQMAAQVGNAFENVPSQAMLALSHAGKNMPKKVPMKGAVL